MGSCLCARRPHRRNRERRLRARPDREALGAGNRTVDPGLGRWRRHGVFAGFFARWPGDGFRPYRGDGGMCGSGKRRRAGCSRTSKAIPIEFAVAFAGDGRLLGSASSDGTVRLWDAGTWRKSQVLRGHRDSVHAVAFTPTAGPSLRLATTGIFAFGTSDQMAQGRSARLSTIAPA